MFCMKGINEKISFVAIMVHRCENGISQKFQRGNTLKETPLTATPSICFSPTPTGKQPLKKGERKEREKY